MITSNYHASKTNPKQIFTTMSKWQTIQDRGRTLCFDTGSHCAAQDDLQLVILLPQPPHSKLTSECTTPS